MSTEQKRKNVTQMNVTNKWIKGKWKGNENDSSKDTIKGWSSNLCKNLNIFFSISLTFLIPSKAIIQMSPS